MRKTAEQSGKRIAVVVCWIMGLLVLIGVFMIRIHHPEKLAAFQDAIYGADRSGMIEVFSQGQDKEGMAPYEMYEEIPD